MMRTGQARALLRPLTSTATCIPRRFTASAAPFNLSQAHKQTSRLAKYGRPLALTSYWSNTALVRHASSAIPGTFQDKEVEKLYSMKKLEANPSGVSSVSSVAPILGKDELKPNEPEPDMMAGIRHDVKVIQQTFALDEVPREALTIGLAGVLPYLATSATTVFCAVELHHTAISGSGYILNGPMATALLEIMEPLQVGYGAVILSFLGAIHWGLEWAGYGGYHSYRRYAIGVIAPAVAWPTILLPVEYALITQFLAFNFLYSVDSNAAARGWVPPWYATYRFVLTFVVGASIVATLIGRGQINDRIGSTPAPAERIMRLKELQAEHEEPAAAEEEE